MKEFTLYFGNNSTSDLINFYQSIDILITMIFKNLACYQNKNTFFHTFNHLHQNGKTADLNSKTVLPYNCKAWKSDFQSPISNKVW